MKYENLVFIRNRLGFSQRELAQKLEVSKSTYARWEIGEKVIPLKHLVDLCNLTNVSLDYALGLSSSKRDLNEKLVIDNKVIGSNLKCFRLNNKLTQKDLAHIINTTQSVISAYESGLVTIQTAFLYDICDKFKVRADSFFDKKNSRNI